MWSSWFSDRQAAHLLRRFLIVSLLLRSDFPVLAKKPLL